MASLVQRWVLGTHHGSVQLEHLDAYLDEFEFRFNRRTSNSRGMLFYRLLQQAVVTAPVTYEDVVGHKTEDERLDGVRQKFRYRHQRHFEVVPGAHTRGQWPDHTPARQVVRSGSGNLAS